MAGEVPLLLGVPWHPLVVHVAVVLVPLAAIGSICCAVWPRLSRRFAVAVVVLAWVGAVATVMAVRTGERLAATEGVPDAHVAASSSAPVLAAALGLAVTGLWLLDRGIPGNRRRPWWVTVLAGVVVVVAVIALVGALRAGVTGAQAAWL